MNIRIILNGKKANILPLRDAIVEVREEFNDNISVRVTYEYGDIHRFIKEAINENVSRLIIGGGDGTLNEAINALMQYPKEERLEIGLLPLGTANDFAMGCNIPIETLDALHLAISQKATPIDTIKVNDKFFINMATGGYGASVTKETPIWLKNIIGGGSYLITGISKFSSMPSYDIEVKTEDMEFNISGVVGIIANGRQSGGGVVLAPKAYINDALFDVLIIKESANENIAKVIEEINNSQLDGLYVKSFQASWIEIKNKISAPLNLDGEPYEDRGEITRYDIMPEAINFVLPYTCPYLRRR